MKEIKALLTDLNTCTSKKDYLDALKTELDNLVNYFNNLGYNVNAQCGFPERQVISQEIIVTYNFFRDVHFLFWGLSENNWIFDPLEKDNYDSLRKEAEEQFNQL